MKIRIVLIAILFQVMQTVKAQIFLNSQIPLSINNSGISPHSSAILDIQDNSRGVLIPRMSEIEKINIPDPEEGLLVYDTTNNCLSILISSQWRCFSQSLYYDNDDEGLIPSTSNSNLNIGQGAGENTDSSGPFEGEFNAFVGHLSGLSNTSGARNTFLGSWSGLSTSIGGANTFLGNGAGQLNTGGSWNIAIGFQAGRGLMNVDKNILIGNNSGNGCVGCSNSIFIGHQSTAYSSAGSFELFIENANNDIPLIHGDFINKEVSISGAVHINEFIKLNPSAAPPSPEEGTIYYDSADKKVKVWDGTTWQILN